MTEIKKTYKYEEVLEASLVYFGGDELAATTWISKYALRAGEKEYLELTPKDMHRRMAREFARIEHKYQKEGREYDPKAKINATVLSEYGKFREDLDEEKIYNLFRNFEKIIPQGSIMATLGTEQVASLSNCWVAPSPLDSYAGIHKTDGDLIYYYKRRGGVGIDISNLRPKGTSTNNTAKSSTGAVSFMERFSNTTREVAMNGRRGALMISMNINHPDIMDFIKVKRDGVSVTGANISIKLNSEFMKAVENDEDYTLRFPCDTPTDLIHKDWGEYNELRVYQLSPSNKIVYIKRIKAKEYWDEIVKSARDFAEPGLMYWDNVLDYDPAAVYPEYSPVSSNPCGEQFLNANDSCRLMAVNLFGFIEDPFTPRARVNYPEAYKTFYEALRLGDDLIDLEVEYIDRIIDKIKQDPEPYYIKEQELDLWEISKKNTLAGRRIGIGITGLGDALAALGIRYDSEEASKFIKTIMEFKLVGELHATIDLSILRAPFEEWNRYLEFPTNSDNITTGGNQFYKFILGNYPKEYLKMYEYGRRNVSWSTIAPTGSVSILTQTTSGIEPLFQPFYIRRKKINPNDKNSRIDFTDGKGDSWQEFPVLHPKFKEWMETWDISNYVGMKNINDLTKKDLQILFEMSPWYGSTANDIDWEKRVRIQALLQTYTTNAISSTINLPKTVDYDLVSKIYMTGWKLGLKGQTVYVDGSRDGVLITDNNKISKFKYIDAVKRPKEIIAEAFSSKTKDNSFSAFVGLLDGKPYEVFITPDNHVKGEGKIIKEKSGTYFFVTGNDKIDISSDITDEQAAITRLVSIALRHGVNIKFIVEQLSKIDGDLFGFVKSLVRILKKYIPNGEVSTLKCENCGSELPMVFEEGCSKCVECGYSKCS